MIPEEPDQALWATRGFEFHFLPLILKPSNVSMFQSMKENIPYPGISRHSESELYCQLPFQRICHGFQHPRAVFFSFFFWTFWVTDKKISHWRWLHTEIYSEKMPRWLRIWKSVTVEILCYLASDCERSPSRWHQARPFLFCSCPLWIWSSHPKKLRRNVTWFLNWPVVRKRPCSCSTVCSVCTLGSFPAFLECLCSAY